ncbi:ATP-binding cassette domain-containing protein [Streptomyces bambusae]|uniref:ATP-binding cassette domain-containing protein n=1 Tax=Streptomyces bambusae TaxID=1550616 RepID=A0ABS6Z3V1_9ACTN|nr:ATP-binding cassette domain-containing protein [Streptomyces bambusae]MBW5482438.1 ATP-binding cassette domain-containing protein [Streptomyces bambusae]
MGKHIASGGRPAPGSAALELGALHYGIGGRTLFDGLDLCLPVGESVAVMGPSGSGKSTLISCALGLVSPQGAVRVAGREITRMRRRDLARHRGAHVGVVFQFGELLPGLTPVENVALAGLLSGASRHDVYADAERLLAELGVPGADRATGTLSGGERRSALPPGVQALRLSVDHATGRANWPDSARPCNASPCRAHPSPRRSHCPTPTFASGNSTAGTPPGGACPPARRRRPRVPWSSWWTDRVGRFPYRR